MMMNSSTSPPHGNFFRSSPLSSPLAKHEFQSHRWRCTEFWSNHKILLISSTLIACVLFHIAALRSSNHFHQHVEEYTTPDPLSTTSTESNPFPSSILPSPTSRLPLSSSSAFRGEPQIQTDAVREEDVEAAMDEMGNDRRSGRDGDSDERGKRQIFNTAKKAVQQVIEQHQPDNGKKTELVQNSQSIPPSQEPNSSPVAPSPSSLAPSSSPSGSPFPSPSLAPSPAHEMFRFTDFSISDSQSCLSNTTIIFAGNSNARAFYFRFLSKLSGGLASDVQTREGQKAVCNLDSKVLSMNSADVSQQGLLGMATCKQMLDRMKLIWNQNVWDLLVKEVFDQQADLLISLAGTLDIFEQQDWRAHIAQEKLELGKAIRNHMSSGPNKQYVQLLLPPVCESNITTQPHFPNVNQNIKEFNNEIAEQVLMNGGSVVDYFSLIEGRWGFDLSAWQSKGCPGYDDWIHPGDEIKFRVINDLLNLHCKKVKRPFHHFWADDYMRGYVPLEQ